MQMPVLIEPIAAGVFRAKTGEPLPLCAEGATPQEALQRLRTLLARRLHQGAQLATLSLPDEHCPPTAEPSERYDRLLQEWKEEIAAYRQKVVEWKQAMAAYRQDVGSAQDSLDAAVKPFLVTRATGRNANAATSDPDREFSDLR